MGCTKVCHPAFHIFIFDEFALVNRLLCSASPPPGIGNDAQQAP